MLGLMLSRSLSIGVMSTEELSFRNIDKRIVCFSRQNSISFKQFKTDFSSFEFLPTERHKKKS